MSEFYGIDLGTTYSCISVIGDDGRPEVVQNPQGFSATPSVVALNEDGTWVVGSSAKSRLGSDPENVVAFIKREMSNPNYKCTLQGKEFTPVEISAQILKYLVDFANKKRRDEEGKDPIYDVAITIPAYFEQLETVRTKEAGEKAGLHVLRLIHEPTAAALSYGFKQKGDKTLLVYDLGGGTFDVSILQFKNHLANVLATRGDDKLGGADWDRQIVDMALKEINANWDDLDKAEQGMIMLAAETAKIALTENEDYHLTFKYRGINDVTIRRSDFESSTRQLLLRTQGFVEEALAAAKMNSSQIDEVIMVGGSSHMPQVPKLLKEIFPNINPKKIDVVTSVSRGAALSTQDDGSGVTMHEERGSFSFGMQTYDRNFRENVVRNLILRDDLLEIHREFDEFSTLEDGQECVQLHFYEARSNKEIMKLDPKLEVNVENLEKQIVNWGFPVPAGTRLKVIVDRDKNNLVTVQVSCSGATIIVPIDWKKKCDIVQG